MDDLRARMRAMREERDPQKRMAMIDMQRKEMAAMMDQMGMAGGGMMGQGGKAPAKGARDKTVPPGMCGGMHGMIGGMEGRMEMMDMRMEMMQMMMEQMLQK
jgi:hypothetical protein